MYPKPYTQNLYFISKWGKIVLATGQRVLNSSFPGERKLIYSKLIYHFGYWIITVL